MRKKCEEDHSIDEETCLECSHKDSGGNWKRWMFCFFLRHDWIYVYSWIGYCQRCFRYRLKKGISFTPLGDGDLISEN